VVSHYVDLTGFTQRIPGQYRTDDLGDDGREQQYIDDGRSKLKPVSSELTGTKLLIDGKGKGEGYPDLRKQ